MGYLNRYLPQYITNYLIQLLNPMNRGNQTGLRMNHQFRNAQPQPPQQLQPQPPQQLQPQPQIQSTEDLIQSLREMGFTTQTRDTLEAVLIANGNNLERTVEYLLLHSQNR